MARKKGFDYFAAMEQLATNGHLAAKRFPCLKTKQKKKNRS